MFSLSRRRRCDRSASPDASASVRISVQDNLKGLSVGGVEDFIFPVQKDEPLPAVNIVNFLVYAAHLLAFLSVREIDISIGYIYQGVAVEKVVQPDCMKRCVI